MCSFWGNGQVLSLIGSRKTSAYEEHLSTEDYLASSSPRWYFFGTLSNFFLVFLKKVSDLLLFSVQTFHFFRYLPFYPNPHFKEWNKSQKFDSVILVEGCKDHLRASVLVVQVRNLRTTPSLGLLMQKNAEFKSHFTCEKWTVTTKLSSSQEQLGSTIFQVQRTNWWMGKVVEFQDHFVTKFDSVNPWRIFRQYEITVGRSSKEFHGAHHRLFTRHFAAYGFRFRFFWSK